MRSIGIAVQPKEELPTQPPQPKGGNGKTPKPAPAPPAGSAEQGDADDD